MIAAPKTMNCHPTLMPRMISIWFSRVRANAATQVEVALARPPESDAPAMTTAAIGASRYEAPNAGSTLTRIDASKTAASA
jgi:hypothetical protein